ncbi:alpha/beta fold hydrolase [Candidatus Foliamicus sp.]
MKFLRGLLRAAAWAVAGVVGLALAGFAVAAWIWRDIPSEKLEARYATQASRFASIDGARIHYRDEGSGPAVVLIHANFASLIGWDPWVEALQDSYRVVRFDMTSHGLSGADATGDYTLARTVQLMERLLDCLEVERAAIVGTSLGGTLAMHYAVRNPERAAGLVLISPGSLEPGVRGRQEPPPISPVADLLRWIMPRALPEFVLRSGFGDPAKLTPELVDRWHDLWRLEGQRLAQLTRLRQYVSGDIEGLIGQVRAPVLIQWGEENPQVHVELAGELARLLKSAPAVETIIYPGVGHMAIQEAPRETAMDARAWLDRVPFARPAYIVELEGQTG